MSCFIQPIAYAALLSNKSFVRFDGDEVCVEKCQSSRVEMSRNEIACFSCKFLMWENPCCTGNMSLGSVYVCRCVNMNVCATITWPCMLWTDVPPSRTLTALHWSVLSPRMMLELYCHRVVRYCLCGYVKYYFWPLGVPIRLLLSRGALSKHTHWHSRCRNPLCPELLQMPVLLSVFGAQ